MATAKERENFIAQMIREYPRMAIPVVADLARKIMRHARTHHQLAEDYCNGPRHLALLPNSLANSVRMDQWEAQCVAKQESCERRLTELCREFALLPRFGGDPRGYTVKLTLPSGAHNTWGGREEGYGVPQ